MVGAGGLAFVSKRNLFESWAIVLVERRGPAVTTRQHNKRMKNRSMEEKERDENGGRFPRRFTES